MIPPALVTGGLLLAAWWRRRAEGEREPLWLTPTVAALAYVGVHASLLGGLNVPRAAADWMPLVALTAGGLGLLAWRWKGRPRGLWIVRAAALVGVGLLMSIGKIRQGWPAVTGGGVLLGFLAHSLAAWWALERVALRRGFEGPAVTMLHALAAGQIVALAYYSLKVAQMPTAMAACMGAAGVVALVRPRFGLARGGVDVPVVVTQAAMLQGWLYSAGEGGRWLPLLLLGVPMAALAAGRAPAPGWKATLLRAGAAGLVAVATIGVAAALRPATDY